VTSQRKSLELLGRLRASYLNIDDEEEEELWGIFGDSDFD